MFEYIKGIIVTLNPTDTVIEVGNIAYYLKISLQTSSKLTLNAPTQLFVHQLIREDAHTLYGFISYPERQLFRLLLAVNGVGPTSAIALLSFMSVTELVHAIAQENSNLLKAAKGIGVKTAQRIVIELKDKITPLLEQAPTAENSLAANNTAYSEALAALTMLGFTKKEAEKALEKLDDISALSVETMVKQALKQL